MRRELLVAAAWSGLAAVEGLVANSYVVRGASWHWLLHVPIGLGVGFAVGALVWVVSGRRVPAVAVALVGELYSLAPDLAFRFLRMPHTQSMDLFLGHIAIHTGPSPVLVALGVLLLGGWAWVGAAYGRPALAGALALSTGGLLLVACLVAGPIPTRLSDYPRDAAPVSLSR